MKRSRLISLTLLASLLLSVIPASAIFVSQSQTGMTRTERMINLADQAKQEVKDLIDSIYGNETILLIIEEVGLLPELQGNVTYLNQGIDILDDANSAFELQEYETASELSTEALAIFRDVFKSVHQILANSGLQDEAQVDYQGLLEAIERALDKIERLRGILPTDANDALAMLNEAESYLDLDEAKALLLEGKVDEVKANLTDANHLIHQVYDYLKEEAQNSNGARLGSYLGIMEQHRERIMERFQYAHQQGIDVSDVLHSMGYQSEAEFIEALDALQNQTQSGNHNNILGIIDELELMSQMSRGMEGALNQTITQHQHQHGQGSGSGNIGTTDSSGMNGSGSSQTGIESGQSDQSGQSGFNYGTGNSGDSVLGPEGGQGQYGQGQSGQGTKNGP